eukprot:CAMPEP_0182428542 /NCGR_PEP_ID=MMETSP1167-20130531/23100_1 /TAXON_ID=2988 /ORGANISM="Mallomonas Sp, Strain CCMP3275" /LENGTH=290 /DNA_ID=CAMNT_0024611501 /DNA_START=175 /DNA_END=1051 /DNA_ORIENTATION=+
MSFLSSDKPPRNKKSKTKKDSSKINVGVAPKDFFDETVEEEKEFLDIATVLERNGGLEDLTSVKNSLTWEAVDDETYHPSTLVQDIKKHMEEVNNEDFSSRSMNDKEDMEPSPAESMLTQKIMAEDLGKHLESLEGVPYVPQEMLNYSIPWRTTEESPEPLLENFLPESSPDKHRYDKQGERSCTGGLQRRGKLGELKCHLIDMDDFHFLDVLALRRFLSDDSEIMPRKHTGLCARCQRKVAKSIKRARHIGVVPHIGEYTIQDSRPLHRDVNYHDTPSNSNEIESKTIL